MPNQMTFAEVDGYIVCYINGVEVSRAKKAADGTSTAEVIDIINDQIKANPTLEGTEPNLEGLKVSGDKYAVPQGESIEYIELSTSSGTLNYEQIQKLTSGNYIKYNNTVLIPNGYEQQGGGLGGSRTYYFASTISNDVYLSMSFTLSLPIPPNATATYTITEVSVGGGGATLEDIVDSAGNRRFVEGDGAVIDNKITNAYCKWSLSGTHLMLVCAGTRPTGAYSDTVATFSLPQWIFDKIFALSTTGEIEQKTIRYYTVGDQITKILILKKEDGVMKIIYYDSGNFTKEFKFRAQFDLLIDADYSE